MTEQTTQPVIVELMPVRASNAIVGARYKYTAHEIDVMCHVLRALQTTSGEINEYCQIVTPIKSIAEHFGNTGRAIEYLRKALKGIQSKPFEFYDAGQYTITNLVSGSLIDTKRMTVTIRVDMFMLPHLVKLKKEFTAFELNNVLQMQSIFSKRIYMMIAQFRATGIFSISLDDLRKRLHLVDKYPEFKDFRRRVLDVAAREINEHTEFDVIVDAQKSGRATDHITFRFTCKNDVAEIIGDENQIKYMIKWGLSDWQIDNVIMSLKPRDIHDVMSSMQKRLNDKTKKPVTNTGGYLKHLFETAGVNLSRELPKQQRMF